MISRNLVCSVTVIDEYACDVGMLIPAREIRKNREGEKGSKRELYLKQSS